MSNILNQATHRYLTCVLRSNKIVYAIVINNTNISKLLKLKIVC